ncbi:NAD(P)/FAD-dependent oxidoreductase [Aeromicrobium fastidiosum]|uniref:FAD-binding oxidoreductase n=1 Tax=Aeromicrobium fastidiosum TaxID=52699 RepID=A0A641AHB3_9ACTN|nr:FAD-binding oxidoreductase [Aeromicrobium fastidiosum]KAA1373081.1 FAD-binding oxidoreductase [Aeromicrobium fastidiosum]MBP2391066.1 glycine/D-amino acid oxidase-like deaminating enzyme [Aeromicrobium fastidiosum]
MNQHQSSPIVVIGAGITGLSIAHHLLAASDREVVVVDSGDVGNGTTPAGAGFVAEWSTVIPHLGPQAYALQKYSLDFYRGIHESGRDVHFRGNGNIVFFNHEDTLAAGLAAIAAGPCASDRNTVVSAAEIGALTGGAVDASAVAGGVLMPSGIQLETGLAIQHIAEGVEQQGGTILRGVTMESLEIDGGRVVGVNLSTGHIATDSVVLAVGAWLNAALAQVDWKLPLVPFVATRFVTEDVGLSPDMPTLQGKDFPLWIRESEGGFTWGSTHGAAPAHRLGGTWNALGKDERWRQDLVDAMAADVDRVAQVFPKLAGAQTIREIQGMPVYSVDGGMFVGEVPNTAGLFAAGGDNESGVSHGPGVGRLLADLVLGRDPICDPTRFRLDRFDPQEYPDPESVGQHYVRGGVGFIADAHREPMPLS